MTQSDVIKLVQALPGAKEIGDNSYWSGTVPKLLNVVIDDIVGYYTWDFASEDYEVSTVADQAAYVLKGGGNDLRDVISIRYDSEKDPLDKLRPADADDLLAGGTTLGGVKGWYQFKRDTSGYPIVTLFDTPDSVKTLYIRYRQKNVPIERMPDEFVGLVAKGVLAWIDAGFISSFIVELKRKIRKYNRGGKDINLVQIDPHIIAGNIARANINGVG